MQILHAAATFYAEQPPAARLDLDNCLSAER
jgi:hypothetical protein